MSDFVMRKRLLEIFSGKWLVRLFFGGYEWTMVVSVYIPLSFLLCFHTITERE